MLFVCTFFPLWLFVLFCKRKNNCGSKPNKSCTADKLWSLTVKMNPNTKNKSFLKKSIFERQEWGDEKGKPRQVLMSIPLFHGQYFWLSSSDWISGWMSSIVRDTCLLSPSYLSGSKHADSWITYPYNVICLSPKLVEPERAIRAS